jgi:hypothetical protein
MPLAIVCPFCQANQHVHHGDAGKKVRCQQCERTFFVPPDDDGPVESEPYLDNLQEVDVRPERRVRREYEDDRSPRRRRYRERSGIPIWVWLLCGGGVLLLFIAIPVVFVLVRGGVGSKRITPENLSKLQIGMTDSQVEAVLGKPHEITDLGAFFGAVNQQMKGAAGGVPSIKFAGWREGDFMILVVYENGRAVSVSGGNVSEVQNQWGRPGAFPRHDPFPKRPSTGRKR